MTTLPFFEIIQVAFPGVEALRVGRLFQLDRERMVIGRKPECDIWLGSSTVGRQHAAVIKAQDKYVIEDLASRCGTRVNNLQIRGPTDLHDGDIVGIGRVYMRFQLESPSDSSEV